MKRAVQVRKVTREALVDIPNVMLYLPLPPVPWVVRGPRGGHYLATGYRERDVVEMDDDFIRNTLSVVDRSEGARYIRPEQARRLVFQ